MGSTEKEMLLLLSFLVFFSRFSNGFVYKVGDAAGWGIIGNVNYSTWSSSKTFHVGDILIFEYMTPYHNVLQVNRLDFHSCNTTAPVATHTSGNDSIVLRSPSHYYYICGFVGHCQAGQKVDIRVPKSNGPASVPLASPIQGHHEFSAPTASLDGPLGEGPSKNSGESLMDYRRMSFSGLLIILIWVLY